MLGTSVASVILRRGRSTVEPEHPVEGGVISDTPEIGDLLDEYKDYCSAHLIDFSHETDPGAVVVKAIYNINIMTMIAAELLKAKFDRLKRRRDSEFVKAK